MGGNKNNSGNGEVGSSTKKCPLQNKPATLVVDLYQEDTRTLIKDASYIIEGPTPKSGTTKGEALIFDDLKPGQYKVSVSVDQLAKYGSESSIRPAKVQGKTLEPDDIATVRFNVYPPASTLLIQVVDSVTGNPITSPGVVFKVEVPKLKKKEDTIAGTGSLQLPVEPGDYSDIKVDLSDPGIGQRYVMAEPGKATVKRGHPAEAKVKLKVRELRLISVDDHFAPSVESLDIKYKIKNMQDQEVWLQIKDAGGAILYEHRLTDPEKADKDDAVFKWDGKTNQTTGAFQAGQYINPTSGPYKVIFAHPLTEPPSPKTDREREFNVFYHSIELDLMPWGDLYKAASGRGDLEYPGGGDQKTERMWVAYKLNELGFPSGPVDGISSEELQKGIRRFRQSSKVLYQRPWEPTSDFEAVAEKPGVLASLGAIDGALIGELKKGTPKRELLDPRVIGNPSSCARAKLYVDHDRQYLGGDEMIEEKRLAATTIKNTVEQEWLNRPLFPIKATISLQNKRGTKSTAPAALGEVKVRWAWLDGAVNDDEGGAGKLPVNKPGEPNQTAVYVAIAQERCRNKIPAKFRNARAVVGGLVTGTNDDERVIFRELPEGLLPFSVLPEGEAATPVHTDTNQRAALAGGSAVLFSPSTIAGDTYQIGASLELPGTLAKGQRELLLRSMTKQKAESGWMTVWRRLRVAAHISWPTMSGAEWDKTFRNLHPGKGAMDIARMWDDVRREYQDAFVEVSGPQLFKTTANFPPDFKQKFEQVIASVTPNRNLTKEEVFWKDVGDAGFLDAAYYPADPPVSGLSETSPQNINDAVRALLDPEVNGPAPGDDPPRLKAFKKWVADWSVLDNGIADPPVPPLSKMEKDAYLVDAAAHYLADPIWEEKTLGGNKTCFKPLSKVSGSTDLAPWRPADDWVLANQDKSGTTVQAINDRILNFLQPELNARHATNENTDMPRTHAFGSLCFRGVPHWTLGKDQAMGHGDVALPFVKGDAFLKEAAKHYKQEMTRLAETKNLGPERKVLRYKRVAIPQPYAASQDLSERISSSLREGVSTPVNNMIKKTQVLLLGELEKAVFAETEPGILILDFKPHKEVVLTSPTGQTENFLAKIFAMANGSGLVIIDQAHLQAYRWYHLFTHELGHCQFLKHWKNAGGYDAMDHDHADENCQMSYCTEKDAAGRIVGVGEHYDVGKYQPHFCGKCNLKLRGWDLRAKTTETDPKGDLIDLLPASSDPSKKVVVIDYIDPVFPYVQKPKVKIPSPNLLEGCITEMMAEMLGESAADAGKHWLNKKVTDAGVVRVIGNPKLVTRGGRATMEWQVLPMETVPEGNPWPGPPGIGRTFDGKEKQAWIDNTEYYALLGGLTAADVGKVELNCHFHYCDFTDLIHETWHLVQKMGGEQPMYEGPTDFFADMLGRRAAVKATSNQARFAYQFNPSYAESVMSVVDQWLPALGLNKLAEVYIKDAKHLEGIVAKTSTLADQLMNSQAWEARAAFKVPRPGEPIRDGRGQLRADLETTIQGAPAALRDELRASIHAFLDFLVSVERTLTGPQKIEVAKYTGTEKFYVLARLARRVRKQYAYTRALRTAESFKQEADAAGKEMRDYDMWISYLKDQLAKLNADRIDPANEIEDASAANDSYLR